MRQGQVHDLLMPIGRRDDDGEVGANSVERGPRVGEELVVGQTQRVASDGKSVGVDIHCAGDFHETIGDVGRQASPAPHLAHGADADK